MKHFTLLIAAFFLMTTINMQAQTLGEFKPKEDSYGLKNLKEANSVYIAAFNVHYQIYNEKSDFKKGGYMLGGGHRSSASAQVSVGLDGITEQDVQEITDKLYADFTGLLKAKGMTLLSPEDAAKTSVYEDYIKLSGGKVSLAQIPGTMTGTPTGYAYFAKKIDKDGKVKKGGFMNFTDMIYPKLSNDLGDAVIAVVDIYVAFVEPKNAFRGNGANVKISTNLRLVNEETVQMTNNSKDFFTQMGYGGTNTITKVSSQVNFYHGKKGLGATTQYNGYLKKPLTISGVIEKTKIQSFANRSSNASSLYGMYYTSPDKHKSSKGTKVIDVDPAKYAAGVYEACKKFMEYHTKQFLGSF